MDLSNVFPFSLLCFYGRALTDCLKDPSLSHPASHLGALVALGALGPAVVAENLLPIFRAYAKALEAKIEALESRKSSKGVEETKMVSNRLLPKLRIIQFSPPPIFSLI